jgi:hypothetical protein
MFSRNQISAYLVILLLFSCTKKAKLVEEGNRTFVYADELKVKLIKEVPWKVGPYYKQKISRGIRIHVGIPQLKKDDMEKLYREKGIDSWLIRVKRRASTSSRTMGYFTVQFAFENQKSHGEIRFNQSNSASLGINYAASSLSTRLDNIPCPALDHRLKINNVEVVKSNTGRKKLFSVTLAETESIRAKVHPIAYSPVTVNGGMQLTGEYLAEAALYRIGKKERASSYVELDDYAKVGREETTVIRGCKGYRIPERSDKDDNLIKKFKFKR